MKLVTLMVTALTIFGAHADKIKFETESTKTIYISESGAQLSAGEATIAKINGQKVMKCAEVGGIKETKNGLSLTTKK